MLIDQSKDLSGIHLYDIIKNNPELETLIKEAVWEEEYFNALPNSAFAWPEKRAYPISSKEQTLVSMLYRTKAAEKVPAFVDAELLKAAEIYGLPTELSLSKETKVAMEDPDLFLFPDQKKVRIKTALDIKQAENVLPTLSQITPSKRIKAAEKLEKRAHELNVSLSTEGTFSCHTPTLRNWIEARATATKVASVKNDYLTLSNALATQQEYIEDKEGLVKLADYLFNLDVAGNLTSLYNKKLLDPVETVFNSSEKIGTAGIDLNGKRVAISKLASYPSEFYSDILGDDIIREASEQGTLDFSKLAAIIETLPRDLKMILAKQMNL